MEQMSSNNKSHSRDFGDSPKFTNWILDSAVMCHMTPQVSYFIPCLSEDMNKYIEVAYGHHVMMKQKGQVRIKMCDNNEYILIETRHNVLFGTRSMR